jgi:hypothetical protein
MLIRTEAAGEEILLVRFGSVRRQSFTKIPLFPAKRNMRNLLARAEGSDKGISVPELTIFFPQ